MGGVSEMNRLVLARPVHGGKAASGTAGMRRHLARRADPDA
jgi:hypothetical protein